jgi:hypothetical protein
MKNHPLFNSLLVNFHDCAKASLGLFNLAIAAQLLQAHSATIIFLTGAGISSLFFCNKKVIDKIREYSQ